MANQFQYLFVGGILGEVLALPFVASYFKDAQDILHRLGARDVAAYYPNSYRSAEENARALAREVQRRTQRSPKPLVLFCHSKACLEVVLSLSENPELYRTHVRRVFCVQPPFKGSSLTERRPGVKRSRIVHRVFRTSAAVWPGLRSLAKDRYTAHFEELARTRPALVELMRDKVVTVRGFKPQQAHVASILKVSHGVLERCGMRTDGLLALDDQELPGFEVPVVELEMDHSDLFTSSIVSNEGVEFRSQALSQLLRLA